MSIEAASLKVQVGADTRDAEVGLRRVDRDIKQVGDGGEHHLRGRLASAAKYAGVAVAAMGVAVGTVAVGFIAKAVKGASDLNETVSKVGVTFEGSAPQVVGWADMMADRFGLVKGELLDSAAGFGLIAQGAGIAAPKAAQMSTDLAGLAADAASFYNVPVGEALEKIKAGLVGEAEPLRAFGVLLSEDAVQARMARDGLLALAGGNEEAAKVMARTSLIEEGLGKAHGDLERTSGSLANRMRELKGRATNFANTAGTALIPIVLKALDVFEGLGKTLAGPMRHAWDSFISGLSGVPIDGASGAFVRLGETAGRVADAFVSFKETVVGVWDIIRSGDDVPQGLGEFIDSALGNTGRYVNIIRDVVGDIQTAWGVLKTVAETAVALIGPALEAAGKALGFIADNWDWLGPVAVGIGAIVLAWEAWQVALKVAAVATRAFTAVQTALNFVMNMNPIGLVVLAIVGLVAALVYAYKHSERFREIVDGAFRAVADAVRWLGEAASNVVRWLVDAWHTVQDTTMSVWNSIVNFFTVTIPEKFRAGVDATIAFLVGLPNAIKEFFLVTIPHAIGEGIGMALRFIIDGVMGWWAFFTETLPKIARSVWDWGMSVYQSVVEWFTLLPGRVRDFFVDTWNAIVEWTRNAYNSTVEWVRNTIDAVGEWLSKLPGRVAQFFRDAWQSIVNAVTDWRNGAMDTGRSAVDGVVESLKALPGAVIQAFKDAIAGIGNMAGEAWNAAKEWGRNFLGGFRDGIEKHSPSAIERDLFQIQSVFGDTVGVARSAIGQMSGMQAKLSPVFNAAGGPAVALAGGGTTVGAPSMQVNITVEGNADQQAITSMTDGLQAAFDQFSSDLMSKIRSGRR